MRSMPAPNVASILDSARELGIRDAQVAVSSRFGCHRRVPISTPMPSGSSARSKRSVSIAWFRLARLICANSSTSSSNITITRETIRAATTNSGSDRHRRSTRTATWSGGSASADFSASTTERPHEGPANYLHLTGKPEVVPRACNPLTHGMTLRLVECSLTRRTTPLIGNSRRTGPRRTGPVADGAATTTETPVSPLRRACSSASTRPLRGRGDAVTGRLSGRAWAARAPSPPSTCAGSARSRHRPAPGIRRRSW